MNISVQMMKIFLNDTNNQNRMQNSYLDIQSITANWENPDQKVYADLKEIHIWRIRTAAFSSDLEKFKSLLTFAETEKINRYKSAASRQTRILSRAILKILLGRYLSLNPDEITFKSDQHKKPIIDNVILKNINFNVSHSGSWILIAIATNPVGVDLEYTDASFTYQNLLDFSFSFEEKNYIQTSKIPHQSFYKLWTRKEALLKATGKGLIDELALIPSLDGLHQNPSQLINSAESWQITSFSIDENHIASTAFMSVKTALQFLNFQL
ncbi:MAG: 4'-phosphopantetheinyl transferase superfamily protein [Cytophagaceae bacterium]|nr:MAG: 4'-phosphopantetheinyl transferase superfamily protein [Cytophagaceae bacterium]